MGLSCEVVMCSYNGEKFIAEQLTSILGQSRSVDRNSIYDDRSSDQTLARIQDCIGDLSGRKKPATRVHINSVNLRHPANFAQGIDLSTYGRPRDGPSRPDSGKAASTWENRTPWISIFLRRSSGSS